MSVLWKRVATMWLRFPSVALAVFLVTAIASMTAISGPAFLASTEEGALREGIEPNRWVAGYRVGFPNFVITYLEREGIETYTDFMETAERFLEERFDEVDGVGKVHVSIGTSAMTAAANEQTVNLRPAFRTDALDHVTVIEGIEGRGAWITDGLASELDVGPGDEIELRLNGNEVSVPLAGVYRHLGSEAPRVFWSSLAPFIYRPPGSFFDPPPLLLMDRQTLLDVSAALGDFGGFLLETPMTRVEMPLDEATRLARTFGQTTRMFRRDEIEDPGDFGGSFTTVDTNSSLHAIAATARERVATVTPVTDVLSSGAEALALALMASTGFFLVRRRRIEVAVLAVRGIGPLVQALRLSAEMMLPFLLGAAAGLFAGFGLVSALGPAADISTAIVGRSMPSIAITLGLGLVAMVMVASVSVRREERAVAEVPGLVSARHMVILGVVIAAGAMFLGSRMIRDISGLDTRALRDPSITAAPVIMILGAAVLAAALFRSVLPHLARLLRFRSAPFYLAARRLSGASMLTQALVLAAVCSLGIAVYAFTISRSIDATADAKARVFIGSDFSALVTDAGTLPDDLSIPATGVTKVERMPTTTGDVSLMSVDPETFAEGAFWVEQFSDRPLKEMLDDLEGPAEPPLKVIATEDLGTDIELSSAAGSVPLEVVGSVEAFPGMPPEGRFVVMTDEALRYAQAEMGASTGAVQDHLWAKGERSVIEGELTRRGILYAQPLSADAVLDTPGLQSLLWMLGLLSALGAGTASICMIGLLLYLQARQRASLISSAMTRRMGLGRRSELWTWGGEIIGALSVALLCAAAVGVGVSSIMADKLDPRPNLVPGPILVVPSAMFVVLAAVVLGVGAVSAWLIRRAMDRADIAAAMRT